MAASLAQDSQRVGRCAPHHGIGRARRRVLHNVAPHHVLDKVKAARSQQRPQADEHGVVLPEIADEPYFSVVDTGGQIDLTQLMRLADISETELRRLNPAFNRQLRSRRIIAHAVRQLELRRLRIQRDVVGKGMHLRINAFIFL